MIKNHAALTVCLMATFAAGLSCGEINSTDSHATDSSSADIPWTASYDTLSKYSYLIYGIAARRVNEGRPQGFVNSGTCFFAKVNGRTFLISAKHVVTGWDAVGDTMIHPYPDTLYVRLPDDLNGATRTISIDIRKIKDTLKGAPFYKDPDVFFVEIKNADQYNLNSIESFFLPNIEDSTIEKSALLFGYPSFDYRQDFNVFIHQPPQHINLAIQSGLGTALKIKEGFDAINYQVEFKGPNAQHGISGSPVFLKGKGTNRILFGGIIAMGDADVGLGRVVKPDPIFEKFNDVLSHRPY